MVQHPQHSSLYVHVAMRPLQSTTLLQNNRGSDPGSFFFFIAYIQPKSIFHQKKTKLKQNTAFKIFKEQTRILKV